ncbi:MAG: hypothetical protein ACRC38_04855, partial [Plesiomonas sp.]
MTFFAVINVVILVPPKAFVSKELASHHEKVPPFLVSVSKLSGAGHVFLSLLFMTFILQCTWK